MRYYDLDATGKMLDWKRQEVPSVVAFAALARWVLNRTSIKSHRVRHSTSDLLNLHCLRGGEGSSLHHRTNSCLCVSESNVSDSHAVASPTL